jgi:Tol biopolymer transport system component
MKKIVSFSLLFYLLLATSCAQPAPIETTPAPPSATPLPSVIPTDTPPPTQTSSPTRTPVPTPLLSKTPLSADFMDQLHAFYVIMFAIQLHTEIVSEAADRVLSEGLPVEDAFTIIREKGLSTERLDSAMQILVNQQITVPEDLSAELTTLWQAHATATDVLSRWMDGEIQPDEVITELKPVLATVETAIGSAEGTIGKLVDQNGKVLTEARQGQLSAQVNQVFPTPVLEACAGESLNEGNVSRRGRVAFVSDRDGNAEIYTMNADGTGLTRLTKNSAGDYAPAWSPDGKRIAFYSQRDGNAEIYVMNADGSNVTRLTIHSKDDFDPTWSPDGTHIAFHSHRASENPAIFVMNSDGSQVSKLDSKNVGGWSPDWSPDGSQILFNSAYGLSRDIWIMNADGSGQINLTHNSEDDWWPAWSPDGERIVFHSDRDGNFEIYLMTILNQEITRLTDDPASEYDPDWSPDGTRIAYTSDRSGNREICIKNIDGKGVFNVTNNQANDWAVAWRP